MTETEKYSLSIMTHNEPWVLSKKTGGKFSWVSYLKEEDGTFEVTVSIVKLDEEEPQIKTRDRIFQDKKDALRYISSTIRNFQEFEFKIFSTNDRYDEDFLQKKIVEWFSPGV